MRRRASTRCWVREPWAWCLGLFVVAAITTPTPVHAELAGTPVGTQAMNFPGTGAGQFLVGGGVQSVGETGLTVDSRSSILPSGDELVEFWWSNGRENASSLADDPNHPSMVSFALGASGQPAGVPRAVFAGIHNRW